MITPEHDKIRPTATLTMFIWLAILGAGCSSLHTSIALNNSFDYLAWRPRLHQSQSRIYVHPDDGGQAAGYADLNLNGGNMTSRLGIATSVGTANFQFFLGCDARLNPQHESDFDIDDYDDDAEVEFRSSNMKDLERLPAGSQAYGYAWIEPGNYTIIPLAGIRFQTASGFSSTLFAGTPSASFRFERGYFRNSELQPLQRDTWHGYGWTAGIAIANDLWDNRIHLGLQFAIEQYPARFSGLDTDIRTYVTALILQLRF